MIFFKNLFFNLFKDFFAITISSFTFYGKTEIKQRLFYRIFKKSINQNLVRNNEWDKNKINTKLIIIVGPWLSELGYELFFWIPFLSNIEKKINIQKIYILSRSDKKFLYSSFFNRKIEYYNINNFELKKNSKNDLKNQKQMKININEKHIVNYFLSLKKLKKKDVELWHPSIFYRLLFQYHNGNYNYKYFSELFKINFIKNEKFNYIKLPQNFVSVKLYNNSYLDIEAYKENIINFYQFILKYFNIVLLNYDSRDDHFFLDLNYENFKSSKFKIYNLSEIYSDINEDNNIALQSYLINKSVFSISNIGGFNYLSALNRKNGLILYSDINSDVMKNFRIFYEKYKNNLEFKLLNISRLKYSQNMFKFRKV